MQFPQRTPKKQQIIETAARLFRDKGYAATSMRDLANAVELKASSLYSHIGSKEEILQLICFENAHRFVQGMQEIEAQVKDPIEQIKALIALHINIAQQDATSITAFNDEWRHLSEPYLGEFLELRKDYEGRFCAILEKGKARGIFISVSTPILFNSILSALRWIYDWYKPERMNSSEMLISDMQTFILGGICGVK